MKPILLLESVTRTFGGLRAVDDVSLSIGEGEIIGLIGPNGAGKSTLINVVSGVHPASAGRIVFDGQDITRCKPHVIARRGIARTFQVVQPFPKMTVRENIATGFAFAGGELSLRKALEKADMLAGEVGLGDFSSDLANTLTLARRKRLELAKSLAMKPKLLFLDEVNAGLNSTEIDDALALIRSIAKSGVTIVLVEHLMKVVLSISERIVVLQHGHPIADGKPADVLSDFKVAQAYLGKKFVADLAAQEAKS